MAHPIAIITDSTCDIPTEWKQKYEITVIPLTIIFGDQTYLDGVDLSAQEFYARLRTDKIHPSTSQPSSQLFLQAYQKAQAQGAEQVLVCTISSAMSGTIESARLAALESPIPVTLHDARNNSMGLGWQVIAAARERERGGDIVQMVSKAQAARDRMVFCISLDTIEYLSRGGRIAEAARLLNSVLQIKPLIYVKPDTGTVGAAIPSRSRKSAIEALLKEFLKQVDGTKPVHLAVMHNDAEDEAITLLERMKNECNLVESFVQIVSPVLGVHTGPRALGLCGYSDD